MEWLPAALQFGGPLIGEALGLIGQLATAKTEEHSSIVERLQNALSALREAQETERADHNMITLETLKAIKEAEDRAAATKFGIESEGTKP